jgi:hypothetical protein
MAQIGEFSFILAAFGVALGLLPAEGQSLILAAALISIALNSLVFRAVEPLQAWIRSRSQLARRLERPADPLAELPASVPAQEVTGGGAWRTTCGPAACRWWSSRRTARWSRSCAARACTRSPATPASRRSSPRRTSSGRGCWWSRLPTREEEAVLLRRVGARVFMGEHELALAMSRHVFESAAPPARPEPRPEAPAGR